MDYNSLAHISSFIRGISITNNVNSQAGAAKTLNFLSKIEQEEPPRETQVLNQFSKRRIHITWIPDSYELFHRTPYSNSDTHLPKNLNKFRPQ